MQGDSDPLAANRQKRPKGGHGHKIQLTPTKANVSEITLTFTVNVVQLMERK